MIKITLILSALLALSTAYVLHNGRADGCLYPDELWGSMDGTKFYFCLPGTDTAIEQSCPDNTFFVKNATVSGCLPIAAVDPNCINVENSTPPACTGNALKQPQPSTDPTVYYLCPSEGATPISLSCADGKAFVHQDGYLGCFEWGSWRTIRNCPA